VWTREVLPHPLPKTVNPIRGIISVPKLAHPKNTGNSIH
jgi:hypothetical protein